MVENVAAAFERTLNDRPGVELLQKAMVPLRAHPTKRREVDILVTIPSGPRSLRLAIDVKNEARPLDQVRLGTLADKFRRLQVDRGIVVSTSGYTDDAEEIYRADGLELLTMEQVEELDWSRARSMEFHVRRVQLLHVEMTYADERFAAARAAFRGLKLHQVQVLDSEGPTKDLLSYLVQILGTQLPREHPVGDILPFHIRLDGSDAEVRRRHRLNGVRRCELADVFICRGRFWIEAQSVPVFNFRYPSGQEAITAVFDDGANQHQLTLIRAEKPGSEAMELRVVAGLATPSRTKV